MEKLPYCKIYCVWVKWTVHTDLHYCGNWALPFVQHSLSISQVHPQTQNHTMFNESLLVLCKMCLLSPTTWSMSDISLFLPGDSCMTWQTPVFRGELFLSGEAKQIYGQSTKVVSISNTDKSRNSVKSVWLDPSPIFYKIPYFSRPLTK